ncbi:MULTISPECIES: neutral zinc metallopeptidase [unclassified Nocardioides]|uniref:KPN_02809 family neutral zinc metallopeptidase n=1 Tax=unclassified Nocardioides TaxID=2615069 RepID=UPI00361EC821
MRFNPKARLDTRRTSDAGRGGGGRSGGLPIPAGVAGGGVGGLIVVVIIVVATMYLGGGDGGAAPAYDTGRMADTDRYASCQTGADANESADCARVAVENSLYDFWSQALPGQSATAFTPEESLRTFSGAVSTGCGSASASVGPFYCPTDRSIYLDTTFFDDVLEQQLGGPSGAFVEPYVLAHEYGHHIQNLLGTMGRVRTQQGPRSDAVRLELQADCYAGMWAGAATGTEDAGGAVLISDLTREDVDQAIAAATAVGDDRIQSASGGNVDPDSWTHGSAEQRVDWFVRGYERGSLDACDTFAPGAL